MEKLHQKISTYIASKISDDEKVADLTQDTLLKVLSYLETGTIDNIEAFAVRIARNLIVDQYRSEKREVFQENYLDQSNSVFDEMVECQELYIDQLDSQSKELLRLVDFQGKSQKELAAEMSISYPSLRSKVQRARKKIRGQFESNCIIEFDTLGKVVSCKNKVCP